MLNRFFMFFSPHISGLKKKSRHSEEEDDEEQTKSSEPKRRAQVFAKPEEEEPPKMHDIKSMFAASKTRNVHKHEQVCPSKSFSGRSKFSSFRIKKMNPINYSRISCLNYKNRKVNQRVLRNRQYNRRRFSLNPLIFLLTKRIKRQYRLHLIRKSSVKKKN